MIRTVWSLRLAHRVLRLVVSADIAAAIVGDLEEELARSDAPRRFADAWVLAQAVSHVMAGLRVAITRRPSLIRVWHDARSAARQWRRRPLMMGLAISTLALAMGATITFFTLIDALAWRPRQVDRPDRLVEVSLVDHTGQPTDVPAAMFREIVARQQVFSALCGYIGSGPQTVDIGGRLFLAPAAFVTGAYFDVVGVHAFLGRMIEPADVGRTASTTAPVVVIGYQFWLVALQGDREAVGRGIRIEGVPFTIVGVAPASFTGMQVETTTDIVVPSSTMSALFGTADDPEYPPLRSLLGRLREGTTIDDARRQLQAMWPSLVAALDSGNPADLQRTRVLGSQPVVRSAATGFSFLRARYVPSLTLLTGLGTWMILVACINVGGLLIAATVARGPEFRVRIALGASRADLVRQLLMEGLAVCVAGALVGFALCAWAARPLLTMLWPPVNLGNVPLSLDWRMTAAILGATAVTTTLAGVVPAWLVTGEASLAGAQHLRTVSPAHTRWQHGLLIAQLALSLSLLVGAGLFVRTLANLRRPNVGADLSRLSLMQLRPRPGSSVSEDDAPYYRNLLEQLSALPRVTSVALANSYPFLGLDRRRKYAIGLATAPPDLRDALTVVDLVSPGFFRTVGARVMQGRDFDWTDHGPRRLAVLSASLAARLFPAGNAIGHVVRIGSDPTHQQVGVIGVVADTDYEDIREPHSLVTFLSIVPEGAGGWGLAIIRSATGPTVSTDVARDRVASLGHQYVDTIRTFDQEENTVLLRERLAATLGASFAALAALLAAMGVYGRLAYTVTRRTRELGIRLALGARPDTLRALVMRDAVRTGCWSVLVGLPLAFALARIAGRSLYGLSPYDPTVFALAILALLVMACGASYVPARRASELDPIEALRSE
jgi:predicted permease